MGSGPSPDIKPGDRNALAPADFTSDKYLRIYLQGHCYEILTAAK
jgi:hypothetical protein